MSKAALLAGEHRVGRRASDTEANARFTALVRRYAAFVWRQLRRFGLSKADADDATQRVFMIANSRLQSIEPADERGFLYGTARRVHSNLRRSQRRRREADETLAADAPATSPLPDELVAQERRVALVDELISALMPPLRRVLVLSEIEELSMREIAELERIPPGTVASRLRRAREQFRALLERHERAQTERGERD